MMFYSSLNNTLCVFSVLDVLQTLIKILQKKKMTLISSIILVLDYYFSNCYIVFNCFEVLLDVFLKYEYML